MDDVAAAASAEDALVEVSDAEASVEEDPRVEAKRVVEASQRKVDKQKEHLAGAEAAFAQAQAALDALNGGAA